MKKYFSKLYVLFFLLSSVFFSFSQEVPFSIRYQNTFKGNIVYVSNNNLNQDPTAAYNGNGSNDGADQVYVDIDGDPTTFNSSAADLVLPSTCSDVVFVGLYWSGTYPFESGNSFFLGGGAADSNRFDPSQIKLKLPGLAYQDITGTVIYDDFVGIGRYYQKPYTCFADITNLVKANPNGQTGTYTVANIRAAQHYIADNIYRYGTSAGWTMVVVYSDNNLTSKNFTVYDGFAGVNGYAAEDNNGSVSQLDFTYNGFQTVPAGQVKGSYGVAALEGDRAINGASLEILNASNAFEALTDAVNPTNNYFNSTISENGNYILTRNPASTNTLGYDADLLTIDATNNSANHLIANNQTAATFRAKAKTTGGARDEYFIFLSSFAIEVYKPEIVIVKSMQDALGNTIPQNGIVNPLDVITYKFSIQNLGNDAAQNVIINDDLPFNATFDLASLYAQDNLGNPITLTTGAPSASQPIQYVYDAVANTISFNIHNSLVQATDPEFFIFFDEQVTNDPNLLSTTCGQEVKNQAKVSYVGTINSTINIQNQDSLSYISACGTDAGTLLPTTAIIDVTTINLTPLVISNTNNCPSNTITQTDLSNAGLDTTLYGNIYTSNIVPPDPANMVTLPISTSGTYYAIGLLDSRFGDCYGVRELNIMVVDIKDTDGDGICDINDIDDDNDGIADTYELCNPNPIEATLFSGQAGGPWIGVFNNSNGSTNVTMNIQNMNPGPSPVNLVLNLSDGSQFDISPSTYQLGSAQTDFIQLDFSTPVRLDDVVLFLYDIDLPTSAIKIIVSGGTSTQALFTSVEDLAFPPAVYSNEIIKSDGTVTMNQRLILKGIGTGTITSLRLETLHNISDGIGFVLGSLCHADTDGDGIEDSLDLDSDNDGISDLTESGQNASLLDANNNGIIDDMEGATPNDADNDGLSDTLEAVYGANNGITPLDTDLDGVVNVLDLDTDNDGIPDAVEVVPTAGYISNDGNVTNDDSDGDGIIDLYDSFVGFGGTFPTPINTDAQYYPDYADVDADGDGLSDYLESGLNPGIDTNGDGIADGIGASYQDPNGIINNPQINLANQSGDTTEVGYRETLDSDGDQIPDTIDIDNDNDGIPDVNEGCGNLIQNASFEYDNFSDPVAFPNGFTSSSGTFIGTDYNTNYLRVWQYTQNMDGWVEGGIANHAPAIHGKQYIDVLGNREVYGSGGLILVPSNETYQVINTNIGETYTVSFYWGEDRGHDAGETVTLLFDVIDDTNNHIISETLTKIAHGPNGSIRGPNTWYFYSNTFVATTAQTRINFSSIPPGNGDLSAGAALDFITVYGSNCLDTDGDTIPDYLDLDADNDGIYDIVEAGNGNLDANHNGIIDDMEGVIPNDTNNNNGLSDAVEPPAPSNDIINYTLPNTDGTGNPNFQDIDSDGDGIVDNVEAQLSATYDTPAYVDIDNNGVDDDYDTNGIWLNPIDTDGDNIPDYLDLDSDNDFDSDALEGWDTDNDGVANTIPIGSDIDNDGLDDAYDIDDTQSNPENIGGPVNYPNLDTPLTSERDWREALDYDGDNIPDTIDLDDDNDGITDFDEISCDMPLVANSNAPVSTEGNYPDQLYFFDWTDAAFTDGIQSGDSQTFNLANGVTIVATFSNVNDGDAFVPTDMITYPYALVGQRYNTPGNREAFYGTDGLYHIFTGRLTLQATKGGIPVPMDILAIDAEATANVAYEEIIYTTNGEPWLLLEDLGLGADIWTGEGTQTIASNFTDGNSNSIYVSHNTTTLDFTVKQNGGSQAIAFGIRLNCDLDGDAIPNYLDLDSDNDGIYDLQESGQLNNGASDTNNDGIIDGGAVSFGVNGLFNNIETNDTITGTTTVNPTDTDTDGIIDAKELDSDNDGCSDSNEAYVNANADGGGGQYGSGVDPAATNPNGTVIAANYQLPDFNYQTSNIVTICNAGPEICNDGIDNDLDGYIDNFDSDCNNVGSPNCFVNAGVPVFTITESSITSNANLLSSLISVTVADLDGDNLPELIAAEGAGNGYFIYHGDGSNFSNTTMDITLDLFLSSIDPVNQPAVGDLNRDGIPEIVSLGRDGRIYVFDNTGAQIMVSDLPTGAPAGSEGGSPRLVDVDENGTVEVVVGSAFFEFDAGFTTLTRRTSYSGTIPQGAISNWEKDPVIVDILPTFAGKEYIAGSKIYSVDLVSGTLILRKDIIGQPGIHNLAFDGPTSVADVNLDGTLDVIFHAPAASALYVWDPSTLTVLYSTYVPNYTSLPTISDVYDDTQDGHAINLPEIVFIDKTDIYCVNVSYPAPIWTLSHSDTSGTTSVNAFDFNGDGIKELVYRDRTDLRIINGNVIPPVNYTTFPSKSSTAAEGPVIADVDNDGQAEIVLVSNNTGGYAGKGELSIFKAGAGTNWVDARDVWNQRGYHYTNVNDDLTIPIQEQSTIVATPQGGTEHHLNTYMTQLSESLIFLNGADVGLIPTADASVQINNISGVCPNIYVTFTVSNTGDVAIPINTPVSFYDSDPTIAGANYLGTIQITSSINVGQSGSFNGMITTASNSPAIFTLFALVNEDGSDAIPIVLNDLGINGIQECDYTNNINSYASVTCQDTDNDNIPDFVDIDDDNDGILDIEECTISNVTSGVWTVPNTTGSHAETDLGNGITILWDITNPGNTISQNPFNPVGDDVATEIFWSDPTMAASNSLEYIYFWDTVVTISYVDSTTGSPISVLNPIIHLDKIGGEVGLNPLSATLTLLGGLTWTELAGTLDFEVTPTTVVDKSLLIGVNGVLNGVDSNWQIDGGTAAGTLQVNGLVSSFSINMANVGSPGTGDGIRMIFEASALCDFDGDNIPNHLDLDSDNDGIYDVEESGQTTNGSGAVDANHDGMLDGAVGMNGYNNLIESNDTSGASPTIATSDSDTDGGIDSLELDSDGDGCNDTTEAGYTDGDSDGLLGNSPVTVDTSGVVTSGTDGYNPYPLDGDTNGVYDFQQDSQYITGITSQPLDQFVYSGNNATFDVVVTSSGTGTPIDYQWQESTDGGATWIDLVNGVMYSGVNTGTLLITGVVESMSGNFYRAIFTSSYVCDDNFISREALLIVPRDTDGDLIPDFSDIDDDNDGILDTEEHVDCADPLSFIETYGQGNRTSSIYTNYCYEDGNGNITCSDFPGNLNVNDGEYAILQFSAPYDINLGASTFSAWPQYSDHTGDPQGRMAVFNASLNPFGEFYNRSGIAVTPNVEQELSFWVINLVNINTLIDPNVRILIKDNLGNTLALYATGNVSPDGQWHNYKISFNPGASNQISFILINNALGGGGNDLAIDDISVNILCDTDGDNIVDSLDLDSDNDGIYDVEESGQTTNGSGAVDANHDGMLDGAVGMNGYNNLIESNDTSGASPTIATSDSDTDGIIDSQELDSDGDGCNDTTEAGYTDGDNDGLLGNSPVTTDVNNGTVTSGADGYNPYPIDGDTNGVYDFQENNNALTSLNATQPADQSVSVGGSASFDVSATLTGTGTSVLEYQWQESTDGGTTWTNVTDGGLYSGSTTAQLTVSGANVTDLCGNKYRVIVSTPSYICDNDYTSRAALLSCADANLVTTKMVDNATPNSGDIISYTISITNNGPSNATLVSLTDILPTGLAYLSDVPSQGTYNSATGVWTIGTINNGSTITLVLNATVGANQDCNTITNTITNISLSQNDPTTTGDILFASIIVNDTTPPSISGSITTTTIEGCDATSVPIPETTVAGIEALTGNPIIADNCSLDANLTVTSSDSVNGTCPTVITRTYTITDEAGNISTIVHTININDTTAPTITGTITATTVEGCTVADVPAAETPVAGIEALTGNPLIADNCTADANLTVTSADTSLGTCPVVVTRTYTIADSCGNSTTLTHTINIDDTTVPTALCQDITVGLDVNGNATITGSDVDGGSTDNCGAVTLSVTPNSFTSADLGANTVTLTVTDSCGNQSTCTAIVTVVDNNPPTALCQDITVQLDSTGNVSIQASDIDNGSTDNGVIVSTTVSPSTFNCTNIGPNTVTLTVTDDAGLTDTCTAIVTVEDNIAPTAICQDIIVQLDASGNVSIQASDIDNGSTDNCNVNLSLSQTTFNCSNIGSNIVTLTVTDDSGNQSTCQATVTVQDGINPTASNPATITVECTSDIPNPDVTVVIDEADNCTATPIVTFISDTSNNQTCPETIDRIYEISDASGNTIQVIQQIVVNDTTAPTVTGTISATTVEGCSIADVPAAETTVAGIEALTGNPLIADNCTADANLTVTSADTSLGTCPVVVTRTYTIADSCGNSTTLTHTINIDDTTDPTASSPADITIDCSADLPAPDVNIINDETDNCTVNPIVSFVSDVSDGNINPEIITRTYSIMDDCGNTITVQQLITILFNNTISAPVGNSPQYLCISDNPTLNNLIVSSPDTGNVYWFDSLTGGNQLPNNTLLVDGTIYYASQSTGSCADRLPIEIFLVPNAPAPDGAANQAFCLADGQTLDNLAVFNNGNFNSIFWYDGADQTTANLLPATTLLVDG
ncbi:FG-GAP-like repeat-containing protein, partial [Lutibacter sp.]